MLVCPARFTQAFARRSTSLASDLGQMMFPETVASPSLIFQIIIIRQVSATFVSSLPHHTRSSNTLPGFQGRTPPNRTAHLRLFKVPLFCENSFPSLICGLCLRISHSLSDNRSIPGNVSCNKPIFFTPGIKFNYDRPKVQSPLPVRLHRRPLLRARRGQDLVLRRNQKGLLQAGSAVSPRYQQIACFSAEKQFILIKESFEQIKMLKGEATLMATEGSAKKDQEYQSVRKNYKDYDEQFEETNQDQKRDYQEFYHQAQGLQGEEYEAIRKSFQNLHEVKDAKFRPIDMKMPDPSRRFFLGQVMHLKRFSDGSNFYLIIIAVGLFGLFFTINSFFLTLTKQRHEDQIYGMLNKRVIRQELTEEELLQNLDTKLQRTVEFKQFKKEFEKQKQDTELKRSQVVPIIRTFVSSSDFSDTIL